MSTTTDQRFLVDPRATPSPNGAAEGDYIYLSPPHVGAEERALLLDAFDSNWIAPAGPHVVALESEAAAALGVSEGVALSSGTAALHLALVALGVAPGDSVMVPSFTFAATVNAVTYVGARPILVDSSRDTWNIDADLVAEALAQMARRGAPPKALVAVDIYGQCADYGRLQEVCPAFDVPIVEDAAEALGATYRGRPAGSFGTVSALSLNGNKIITAGGGGVLGTDRVDLADRCRYLSTQAREPTPHYEHTTVGYNYRLSNPLAAVGRGQLRRLPEHVLARRRNNALYREALSGEAGVEFMPQAAYGESNCWLTCLLVSPLQFGATTEQVRRHLASRGIEARPTWKPMHCQPVFASCDMFGGSVAEDLYARGLCLPSGSNLTDSDRWRVVEAVRSTPRTGS